MRIESSPLTYVFDSREDVLREIREGSHRHNLVAFECPRCGRIHVHVLTPMLTPFSRPDHIRAPASVSMDVTNWRGPHPSEPAPSACPTCGIPMRPVSPGDAG